MWCVWVGVGVVGMDGCECGGMGGVVGMGVW